MRRACRCASSRWATTRPTRSSWCGTRACIDPFFSDDRLQVPSRLLHQRLRAGAAGRPARARTRRSTTWRKDYDSFRHTLMAAMAERVPGWQSTSEADHDQVLIDLFAAAADELSDYQDRVMSEAYLGDHAQARLAGPPRAADGLPPARGQSGQHLARARRRSPARRRSRWTIRNWSSGPAPSPPLPEVGVLRQPPAPARAGAAPALRSAASTSCACTPGATPNRRCARAAPAPTSCRPRGWRRRPEADALRDLVRNGQLRADADRRAAEPADRPHTGPAIRASASCCGCCRRDVGRGAAESILDPVTSTWLVRVHWRDEDALRLRLQLHHLLRRPARRPVEDVSVFYGNLVPVHEGRPMEVHFHEPGSALPTDTAETSSIATSSG